MAATGYTPILIYASGTAAAVPLAADLTTSATTGAELAINYTDGKLYYKNNSGTVTLLASSSGASGDVVGPASATDNALARFDLTTGKLIQNSVGILSDAGILTGLTGLTSSGSITLSSLTSGRVTYAGTAGLLQDSANLTFNGTTLTANTIGAFTLGGTIAGGSNQINNIIIGTTTPLAGSFTAVNATSITNSGLTSGRVVYSTTSGLETDSANLLYSGTDLTVYGLTVGRGLAGVATNTVLGASALAANTTGSRTVAIGDNALLVNTSGVRLVAVGSEALTTNTTGSYNTGVGWRAMQNNTTGEYNTAVGSTALNLNTTASNNTAVGYQAGYSGVTATQLVAVGSGALYANTVNYGTAVGYNALNANTTGAANAAFGAYALSTNTTGQANSAFGGFGFGLSDSALQANTTGSYNSAFGLGALASNTTASNNTAVGYQAGYSNTTASNSTIVGYQAGYTNQTGTGQTFLGQNAGRTSNPSATTGYNTIIGNQAGYYLSTGVDNTFIGSSVGRGSGQNMTTGSKNTIIGTFDGNENGLDIRTADNYIVISDGSGNRQITMAEGLTLALDSAVPNTGTGITFPATQSASSNANTLDDYEEGTWTPTCNAGATLTLSGSPQYTKIGRQVTIHAEFSVSVNVSGTQFQISGLPFASNNSTGNSTGVTLGYFAVDIAGYLPSNASTITFQNLAASANKTNAEVSGNYFIIACTYFTA